jgi:DNA-binding IclR family transcriptional regulator
MPNAIDASAIQLDTSGADQTIRLGQVGAEATAAASSAVDRALAVLCAFSRETPVLGVTEISARLELTKSTVHRALQALVAHGLVMQDPARRSYTLGYRVLALAQAVPGEADLRQICRPHMRWLHSVTDETIALYVAAGDVRMCLDELESPQMLRMSAGIGRCFPLHRGSASKALLIDGPEGSGLWRRVAPALAPDEYARLVAELREARSRGYVVTMGETVSGAASIAAPLRGPGGEVIAALSVGAPVTRFTTEAIGRFTGALIETATGIQRDLAAASAQKTPPTGRQR